MPNKVLTVRSLLASGIENLRCGAQLAFRLLRSVLTFRALLLLETFLIILIGFTISWNGLGVHSLLGAQEANGIQAIGAILCIVALTDSVYVSIHATGHLYLVFKTLSIFITALMDAALFAFGWNVLSANNIFVASDVGFGAAFGLCLISAFICRLVTVQDEGLTRRVNRGFTEVQECFDEVSSKLAAPVQYQENLDTDYESWEPGKLTELRKLLEDRVAVDWNNYKEVYECLECGQEYKSLTDFALMDTCEYEAI